MAEEERRGTPWVQTRALVAYESPRRAEEALDGGRRRRRGQHPHGHACQVRHLPTMLLPEGERTCVHARLIGERDVPRNLVLDEAAYVHIHAAEGTLWVVNEDTGFLVLLSDRTVKQFSQQ